MSISNQTWRFGCKMTDLCMELHQEKQYIDLPPTSILAHYAFMELDRLMICCCQDDPNIRNCPALYFKPCEDAWQGNCRAFKV